MKYKRKEIDYVHISMLSIINAEMRNGWELTSLTYREDERVRLKFRKPILKNKIMIKREEYLKALDIVEAYHKQLNLQIVKRSFSRVKDLQETDFVEVVKVDTNTQRSLTVGKKYQILRFSDGKYRFTIIDDNGKEKEYSTDYGKTFKPVPPNYA